MNLYFRLIIIHTFKKQQISVFQTIYFRKLPHVDCYLSTQPKPSAPFPSLTTMTWDRKKNTNDRYAVLSIIYIHCIGNKNQMQKTHTNKYLALPLFTIYKKQMYMWAEEYQNSLFSPRHSGPPELLTEPTTTTKIHQRQTHSTQSTLLTSLGCICTLYWFDL